MNLAATCHEGRIEDDLSERHLVGTGYDQNDTELGGKGGRFSLELCGPVAHGSESTLRACMTSHDGKTSYERLKGEPGKGARRLVAKEASGEPPRKTHMHVEGRRVLACVIERDDVSGVLLTRTVRRKLKESDGNGVIWTNSSDCRVAKAKMTASRMAKASEEKW